jgi:hypothetical protein
MNPEERCLESGDEESTVIKYSVLTRIDKIADMRGTQTRAALFASVSAPAYPRLSHPQM